MANEPDEVNVTIHSVGPTDLPWHLRLQRAYQERKRGIYEKPASGDDLLTRALRWWFMPRDQSAVEILPVRALRGVVRRPRGSVGSLSTEWIPAALKEDARLLDQLHRQAKVGLRPATVREMRWKRGPMGVKVVDDPSKPVTFQTIANDLRAVADTLDSVARIEHRDRIRND